MPNANYLWINLFATSLKPSGRAALVMANSASDARHSEADIRRTLIEKNLIYGMLTLPSNMFYTVTLPATLWFFDKAKADDRILFIDARNIFTQIDRAHREFSDEQIQNIAIIPRLHKGRRQEFVALSTATSSKGMARLVENQAHIPALAERLLAVLGEEDDAQAARRAAGGGAPARAVGEPWRRWCRRNRPTAQAHGASEDVDTRNHAQHALRQQFTPFFTALHASLKQLDKTIREHGEAQGRSRQGGGQARRRRTGKPRALKDARAGAARRGEDGRELLPAHRVAAGTVSRRRTTRT